MELIIYLVIGAIAGFTAGLFGVGGGLTIVPILYVVFLQQGYAADVVMHMAVGTSLATIIVTSISSIMAHHRQGAVQWNVVQTLAPGLVLGALLGAAVADILSGQHLQLLIGIFALLVAYRMWRGVEAAVHAQQQLPSQTLQRSAGGVIGLASAIFGIGGGSLTVPYLTRYGVRMQSAVATSAACGLPIAVAGAMGFMWFGQQQQQPILHAIGYVHIYAFLGISSMSFLTAKVGAAVAHALSARKLKQYFALLLCLVGCYFIFQALGA